MKQLIQNVNSGEISVAEVPAPARDDRSLLVATRFSVISAGTERAVMELGNASLVGKARARPDLVRKVVDAARTDGLKQTYTKVRSRLDEPNTLGYSSAGIVVESCPGAPAAPGDLVACAGAGLATHAEVVAVPRNLCARIPDGVAPEDAAYATVASIALHGMRIAEVGLGDVVAVIGLGLLGQICLELVAAAGGVPVGIDPSEDRVALARAAGFAAVRDGIDLDAEVGARTSGRGADAVLVCAAAKSADPLATATSVARERATISIVGDVTISSPRAPLFAKELRLVVSRSYGPGRYDPSYEDRGIDYPAGYVRWTEGRNLAEVLRLMASGQLRPARLTTHTFDLSDGVEAYRLLDSEEPSLGILLRYEGDPLTVARRSMTRTTPARAVSGRPRVGLIGAGQFARGVLIPEIVKGGDVVAVATSTGVSARTTGERHGARLITTDPHELLADDAVDAVVIATRHDTHSSLTAAALRAGKHVFVEKPLALDAEGLDEVAAALADAPGTLMVGFNRRFAPLAVQMRRAVCETGPVMLSYRINAGALPAGHWTQDRDEGGGRIIGEVCHFVDLAMFLTGSPVTGVTAAALEGSAEPREDSVAATLTFADGSVASIVYSALGDASLPKERVEVLSSSGAAILDDFRELTVHRGGREKIVKERRDKGHAAEISAFLRGCAAGEQAWPADEMVACMEATFAIDAAVAGARPG